MDELERLMDALEAAVTRRTVAAVDEDSVDFKAQDKKSSEAEAAIRAHVAALEAEAARLKAIISASEAVVNSAAEQAEARLHAEVERDTLKAVLRGIQETAAECIRVGYTTSETCVWQVAEQVSAALNPDHLREDTNEKGGE